MRMIACYLKGNVADAWSRIAHPIDNIIGLARRKALNEAMCSRYLLTCSSFEMNSGFGVYDTDGNQIKERSNSKNHNRSLN